MSEITPDNVYRLTRTYDASVQEVWDAIADPVKTAQWWGPRGFTLTSRSKDFRAGGYWDYIMHGPDGTDFPNFSRYIEVVPHQKLVYDHGAKDDKNPMFRMAMDFSESGGKTTLKIDLIFSSAQEAVSKRQYIKKAGGDACWDRLAEFLAKSSGKEIFVINRSFKIPIQKMFEIWTTPDKIARWLAPTGFDMKFIHADIKTSGSSFYFMTDGKVKFYGKVNYLNIQKPNQLVYIQQFVDENQKPSRHPMAPTFPSAMMTEVEFTEEESGFTRVTVTWEPQGPVTPEEMATFIQARPGMTVGWTGSFDKLDAQMDQLRFPPIGTAPHLANF